MPGAAGRFSQHAITAAVIAASALAATFGARVLGCQPNEATVRAPTAQGVASPAAAPTDAGEAPPLAADEKPPPASRVTADLVREALGLPYAVERKDSDDLVRPDAGFARGVVWEESFPSPSDEGLELLGLLLYDGPSRFEEVFEQEPSTSDYVRSRIAESASDVPIGRGRTARIRTMPMFLGGLMRWATLRSPRGRFELVVYANVPLHDAPLSDAGRAAIDELADDAGLARVAARLDAALWP